VTIRAVVVDDSVVIRRLVVQVLESDPDFEVVGTAANGKIALAKVAQQQPDLVVMDVEMPEMNGIEAVRELRKLGHRMPIIMFSTLTERGATATLDALAAGASDYVAKPSNMGSITQSLNAVASQLIPKASALLPGKASPRHPSGALAGGVSSQSSQHSTVLKAGFNQAGVKLHAPAQPHPISAVIIGSSTGGPEALSKVISGLTEQLPVPILVVQHMPPVFTKQLAARLDKLSPHTVVEAAGGEQLRPGTIYVAPGDYHLVVEAKATGIYTALTKTPPVNFCRPSVDVMFQAAREAFGGELLSVVLTGMGSDGKNGAGSVIEAGGTVYVQDQETSVVWGMPGAVATAGSAHKILPITEVAPAIMAAVHGAPIKGAKRY